MLNKRIIAAGLLTASLFLPMSEAKAQGYPTFDVAKLASLITNLVGRFQPVPQVLSRITQVKQTLTQIQAVGQAAMAGDLKALGKEASKTLKSDAFSGGKKSGIDEDAEGSDDVSGLANKIKNKYFIKNKGKVTNEEINEVNKLREEERDNANKSKLAKTLFMAKNAGKQAEERLKKVEDALKNASTVQDSVNANTMMIMAANFDRLNKISLALSALKSSTSELMRQMPATGYGKPEMEKIPEGALGEGTVVEKDEIDVDLD